MANYDFSNFHKDCGDLYIINAPDGMHVYCPKCQVIANVEAISGRVTAADACKVITEGQNRTVIAKQSANVDKGAYVA